MKKAAYVLWASDYHINRLINAGVDTLLIPDYNTPPIPIETRQMPSHSRTLEILERFQGKVKLVIVPIWFQTWFNLPVDESFVNEKGVIFRRTPCPTAASYFHRRFNVLERLWVEHKIDGVVWDLEDYTSHVGGTHKFFSKDKMPRCHCSRCKTNFVDQYAYFKGQWRFNMRPFDIAGFMPYADEWVTDLFPTNSTWFCEKTYIKNKYWTTYKDKIRGFDGPAMAGLWMEKHTAAGLGNYVDDVMDEKPFGCGVKYDGIWLYTHTRFNGTEHLPCPGPYCGPLGDEYYNQIRML